MQINGLQSSLAAGSALTLDKVKAARQNDDFASRINEIMNAKADQASAQAKTGGGKSKDEDAKLRKVCQDLEAVFLNMMLTQMRASVPKSTLMGEKNNNAEDIYQSMLDSEMTKDMAKAGGIGLGEMVYRQLTMKNITASPARRPVTAPDQK